MQRSTALCAEISIAQLQRQSFVESSGSRPRTICLPPRLVTARRPWSPRTQQLEVAGEWYRAENLRALFARHAKVSDSGTEIRLPAVLVPDAANPHDDKAVAVFVDGLHVGYMERPDAKKYHPVGVLSTTQTANFMPLVRRAEAEGRQIFCRASLRGNTLKADVALHARKAHELDETELQELFANRSS